MRRAEKSDFEGKTIRKIDIGASNMWRITFDDGSSIEIWAENEGPIRIPTLLVDHATESRK